ncbi:hypothetical protein [Nocardiopsis sp. NPDC055824]
MTLFIDRDGEAWEVPLDMLRHTETSRMMLFDEVESFFGPLTEQEEETP